MPEIEGRPTDIGVSNENHEIPLTRGLNLIQTTFLGVGTAIGGVMFAILGRAVGAAGPRFSTARSLRRRTGRRGMSWKGLTG